MTLLRWWDAFHIVSAIPVLIAMGFVILALALRKKQTPALIRRSTTTVRARTGARVRAQPRTQGTPLARGVLNGVICTLVFLIGIWAVTGFLATFTPVAGWFYDTDYEEFTARMDAKIEIGTVEAYQDAFSKIEERLEKGLSPQKQQELALRGYDHLITAAKKQPDGNEKRATLNRAKQWATRWGLKTGEVDALIALAQPTATPRPTPVPSPTPQPTRTPTPVPTPIVKPGESNPCVIPRQFTAVEQILLHPAVPQEASGRIPEEFGHASKTIQIEGNELAVCIAGSPDGKKAPKVDDQAEFDVYLGSTKIGGFPMPFYDRVTKGIKEWPPQKAEWLFPRPGTYRVNTVLTDLIGNVRSSSELWIVIWR